MITLTSGMPGAGMTLADCGPSDLNGKAPVVVTPAEPGPGVRSSLNASTWRQIGEFLTVQQLALLGLRLLP